MKVKQAGKYITHKQRVKILADLEYWNKPLMYAVEIVLRTGIRVGEVQSYVEKSLECNDEYFEFQPLKHNNIRKIKNFQDLAKGANGMSLKDSALKKAIQRFSFCYGTDISFHDLRHTFITNVAKHCNSIFTMQALTGHKSPQVLMKYIHNSQIESEHLFDYGYDPLVYNENFDYYKGYLAELNTNRTLRDKIKEYESRLKEGKVSQWQS